MTEVRASIGLSWSLAPQIRQGMPMPRPGIAFRVRVRGLDVSKGVFSERAAGFSPYGM